MHWETKFNQVMHKQVENYLRFLFSAKRHLREVHFNK